MTVGSSSIADLPNALHGDELARRIGDARPAVFLDYDGTLTPIVDRPQDAVISERMREAVSGLAARCTVCVVSGRDRQVVQKLMGVHDLVVAGSHGFDIAGPRGLRKQVGTQFLPKLDMIEKELGKQLAGIAGARAMQGGIAGGVAGIPFGPVGVGIGAAAGGVLGTAEGFMENYSKAQGAKQNRKTTDEFVKALRENNAGAAAGAPAQAVMSTTPISLNVDGRVLAPQAKSVIDIT